MLNPETNSDMYILCNTCNQPVKFENTNDCKVVCPNCGHENSTCRHKDTNKTIAYTFAALIFYFPANLLPFMTLEMYGNKTEATIWSGIVSLAEGGSWFLALIVFLASMLIPFVKLFALFYLALTARNGKYRQFKTKLFKFVEMVGHWSMLDVFLLAVLVAVVKLDAMASVSAKEGSLMFLFVVIFTILASSSFDPKIIWENNNESK